jgi:Uri superfamily endonuclease
MSKGADESTDDGSPREADGSNASVPDSEGTYTLVVELAEPAVVKVGALGRRELAAGWYAYTGSAFGPGGFARVERHRELAAGERDARHWHVDYLLGHPAAAVDRVITTPGADIECAVARAIEGERIPAFGASDCACDSHLVYGPDRAALVWSVERAHERDRSDT